MSVRFNDLEFRPLFDGIQAIVDYGDYELSIVRHSGSYGNAHGLYEIAIFKEGEQVELAGVTMEGDTIKGYLTEENVNGIMLKMNTLTGIDGVQV